MKKPAGILVMILAMVAIIVGILTAVSIELGLIGGLALTFLVVTWMGASEMHRTPPGQPISVAAPIIGCFSAVIITSATYLHNSYLQIAMIVIPSLSAATLLFFWGRYHQVGRKGD